MGLLDNLWDDVAAGPQPEQGLGKLRKITPKPINTDQGEGGMMGRFFGRSLSMSSGTGAGAGAGAGGSTTPVTPSTPTTPSTARKDDNVWRSVFNPGSNLNSRSMGSNVYDKPQPNTPTVYDWLYSGDTRSKHR